MLPVKEAVSAPQHEIPRISSISGVHERLDYSLGRLCATRRIRTLSGSDLNSLWMRRVLETRGVH